MGQTALYFVYFLSIRILGYTVTQTTQFLKIFFIPSTLLLYLVIGLGPTDSLWSLGYGCRSHMEAKGLEAAVSSVFYFVFHNDMEATYGKSGPQLR
jgi:hypothetical protein